MTLKETSDLFPHRCVCRQMAPRSSYSYRAGKRGFDQKSRLLIVFVCCSFVLCFLVSLTEKDTLITALQEELREVKEKAVDEVRVC